MPISKIKTSSILADAASTNLNIDAGTLFLDATNNRVGINTTTLTGSTRMVVADATGNGQIRAIHSTGSGLLINQATASGVAYIQQQDNAALAFATNNTERMRVDASGNVCIGNTTGGAFLDVGPTTSPSIAALILRGGAGLGNTGGLALYTMDTANATARNWGVVSNSSAYGDFSIRQGTSLGASPFSAGVDRFYIDASGNVGISTNAPGEKLHVSGNIRMSAVAGTNTNAALPVLFQTSTGTIEGGSGLTYNPGGDVLSVNGMSITASTCSGAGSSATFTCANGSGQYDFVATSDSLRFTAGSSERMRIISDGSVGIGTSSPTSRLHGLANADESLSLVSVSSTRAAIGEIKAETRQCSFNVNNTSNFAISNIVTTTSGWRVVFRGSWSNNYEGGGLTSPAPELEATSAFPSFLVGSRTLTVSRNGTTGFLQVNAGDAYYISFAGSIEIFQNAQSGNAAVSKQLVGRINTQLFGDSAALQVKGSFAGNPVIFEAGQSSSDGYLQIWDAARSTSTKLTGWTSGQNWFAGSCGFGGTTTTATYPISVSQGVPTNSSGNARIKIGNHIIQGTANDDMFIYGYNGNTTGALLYVGGYYTFSARSIKSNIVKLENSLEKICQLNGYSYTITETGRDDIGLIADEVEELFPDLVSHDTETGEANSVDYSSLVAVLIESIKEQQALITQLTDRITALEAK